MADPVLLAEAYKRGLLPTDKAAAYEEGVRRGLIQDEFASGALKAKSGLGGAITGGMATVNAAIPGMDEVTAGLDAAGRVIGGANPSAAWKGARDRQQGLMTGFRQEHPVLSDLATGTGYAAQAVPALMTGGATVAPQVTGAVGKPLAARVVGTAMTGAKNATVGATYAAGNALAGKGNLSERVAAADKAIPTGAAVGVVAPVAMAAAGKAATMTGNVIASVAKTGVRAANAIAAKTPAGAFLDPQNEVLGRLGEALQKDKLPPATISAALDEWNRVGGASPAFMDIVAKNGGGQNTMALIRGAAMNGEGRNVASQYGNKVAADLQDVATDRTRALTPDTRTLPAINSDIEGRIATNSTPAEVPAGSGGAPIHQALNASFDTAKAGVDNAYSAAREAAPEGAHLEAAQLPQLAANVREAVRDFHPTDAPRVYNALSTLDQTSTPTVRDLYDLRQRLSNLRMSGDPVEGAAASRATRALDGEIQAAHDNNGITGDPGVVDLWRTAIGARRDFGQRFEGNDLINQLTERGTHGAGRTTTVAPEDASNTILGRANISQRPNLVRDLTRLRDTLGPDSPEWRGLQSEAIHRVIGRDVGSENFGQSWDRFASQSPDLARLLMPAERAADLTARRANITGAVADRTAVNVGRGVLSTPSDEYAVSMTGVNGRVPLAQVGAARELAGMIERPTEGATGVLNRVASSTRATKNLASTYGDQPAADYQRSVGNAVEKVQNARFINPNSGSQTAPRLADETLVERIPTSKAGLVKAILDRFKAGATLTEAERAELVKLATGDAGKVAPKIMARTPHSPVSMTRRPPIIPVIAAPMTQDQRR